MSLAGLDAALEDAVSTVVLARLAQSFTVATWVSPNTTPKLVRKIIAMKYACRAYARQYSEDPGENDYALRLCADADLLLDAIANGTLVLVEVPGTDVGGIVFYPTDSSSALEATHDDPSLGPAAFTMGTIW